MKILNTTSKDSTPIRYSLSGNGETCLLFIHGWLGNKSWWDSQVKFFEKNYLVSAMDLGGHGDSGKRSEFSVKTYAQDIAAVANAIQAKKMILIGHSMSGAYVLEAVKLISKPTSLIVIDTLRDFDFAFTHDQIIQMKGLYKTDFKMAVDNILPQYLFTSETPNEVRVRLSNEFKAQESIAWEALEPLYYMNLKESGLGVKVPVRAINSDVAPTNLEANRKYLIDYDFKTIKGTGHYPMLEKPEEFNHILKELLDKTHVGE